MFTLTLKGGGNPSKEGAEVHPGGRGVCKDGLRIRSTGGGPGTGPDDQH